MKRLLGILDPEYQSLIVRILYRYRFLFNYIIIGFLSICVELLIFQAINNYLTLLLAQTFGFIVGVIFAFVLNVRFNFKIPSPKRRRAFVLFLIISCISLILTLLFREFILAHLGLTYEVSRFVSSGCLFFIGYILNRKFTFKGYKQVGVAIYSDGEENIKAIWDKIKAVSDFIHVDIVDDTFNASAPRPAVYRMEAIKAFWPKKEIHCHIMSKYPSRWIKEIVDFADTIVIHYEIKEDIKAIISEIRKINKKVGICLLLETPIKAVNEFYNEIDEVMLLAIKKPGCSGQKFDVQILDKINYLNKLERGSNLDVCIDGGVNEHIIHLLNVGKVVSGAFVLNNNNPIKKIMQLQTSSQYERI